MKIRFLLSMMCLLLLCGCKTAAKSAPVPAENTGADTSVVSSVSASGGEVKMPAVVPSGSPAPQSSLSFEKSGEDVAYGFASEGLLKVSGGLLTIHVAGQALECDISIAEGASVRLMLTNGAAFTGTFLTDYPQSAFVTLDECSTWALSADTAVSGITNGNAAFANIVSNGYSITYDSSIEENSYLNSNSLQLPGGGFLTPII
ncbi:MAG: hypothetical protein RRZ24_05235 [Clostridia bacterium]